MSYTTRTLATQHPPTAQRFTVNCINCHVEIPGEKELHNHSCMQSTLNLLNKGINVQVSHRQGLYSPTETDSHFWGRFED